MTTAISNEWYPRHFFLKQLVFAMTHQWKAKIKCLIQEPAHSQCFYQQKPQEYTLSIPDLLWDESEISVSQLKLTQMKQCIAFGIVIYRYISCGVAVEMLEQKGEQFCWLSGEELCTLRVHAVAVLWQWAEPHGFPWYIRKYMWLGVTQLKLALQAAPADPSSPCRANRAKRRKSVIVTHCPFSLHRSHSITSPFLR